jgi:hypothetical protein
MKPAALLGAAMLAAAVAVIGPAAPVHAEPADVAAQIKLIETQPADLDRATWKDRRRDAARKLGQSRDRRAAAVLIKLAETETFDVIGEIAIEGLGNLGDPAAVPVLQKIAGDPSRDRSQRDLARKALARLGADARPTGTPGAGPPPPPPPPHPRPPPRPPPPRPPRPHRPPRPPARPPPRPAPRRPRPGRPPRRPPAPA